jgi:Putative peptidoglycan binding domain
MPAPDDTLASPPPASVRARPRLSRGGAIGLLLAAGAVAAVVIVLTTGVLGGNGGSGAGVVDNSFATGSTTVKRMSITSQTQVSATLGYADPSTIVLPAGTAPSAVQQAQQAATTAESQLQSAQTALASDSGTLGQDRASLAAARAKEAVDCRGAGAAGSPPNSSAGAGGGGGNSSPCASDEQTVSAATQSVDADQAKVAADQTQVTSAQSGLAGAQSSLAQAQSSGAFYATGATYTTLPAVGTIVERGQALYAIGGEPVVLLYGRVAPWRAFMAGMTPGRDVAELNANLSALGYGKGLAGDAFTAATADAIDAFQSAHGLEQTGELLLGSVVFEPGQVRVTAVTPTAGATAQPGPVLSITSTTREVTIELDAAQQSDVKVGDPVLITLPDNSTTPGKISYVGSVATTSSDQGGGGGGSSTPTIEVDVAPTDPAATGHLDQAPVNVSITENSAKNALVVPVNALLALSGGGYALEEIGAGGARHLVSVSLGLFDDQDGVVQVTGSGVQAGQRIVVPGE